MDTRETVDEFLRRFGEGDPERIAQLFAEEVDWKLDWPDTDHGGPVPWIRRRDGRAAIADHFRSIAEHHVPGRSDARIHAVLVDGADAVVLGEVAHTARPTGRGYVAAVALHLTVAGGSITRFHIYEDSLAVARAFDAA